MSSKRETSKMVLYIPTRGRTTEEQQDTLRSLPESWRKGRTVVVCPQAEMKWFKEHFPGTAVLPQPDPKMTIAAKRKWIFERAHRQGFQKIMMLDDDLRFGLRHEFHKEFAGYGRRPWPEWNKFHERNPDAHRLYLTQPDDPKLPKMFQQIELMLNKFAHGGISPRLMNQQFGYQFSINMRVNYALAFHVPTVIQHVKLGRIEHREDYDYTLQLMKAGFENAVYTWGICEQYHGFGAEGGASDERSVKASNADAHKLARLHPGMVRVVEKNYKASWDKTGDSIVKNRLEVVISWKKAAEQGQCEFL